jgi:hypothetical protein
MGAASVTSLDHSLTEAEGGEGIHSPASLFRASSGPLHVWVPVCARVRPKGTSPPYGSSHAASSIQTSKNTYLPGRAVNRGYWLRSMTMRPTMSATKAVPSKTISIKVMTDKVRLLAL